MFSRTLSWSAVSVLTLALVLSICPGLSENFSWAENPPGFPDLPDLCENNVEYTTDFRIEDCRFKTRGVNPYFILKPGYRLVLETPEDLEPDEPGEEVVREKSVETVLHDTKWIHLDGRRIKTRVLEERAFEWEEGEGGEEGEWKTIEISLNYFAICDKTNAIYYFGEWSRDCENGFNEDDECEEGNESNAGSWEAGVDGALPGIMMPGTPLLGAKYFQEIAPAVAADRGEISELGLDWPESEELDPGEESDFSGCIKIFDTNPTDPEACGEEDAKIYCPGIGLVQDQDLELVSSGYAGDDDDDGDHDGIRRWHRKHHRWH